MNGRNKWIIIILILMIMGWGLFAEDRVVHVFMDPASPKNRINFNAEYYRSVYPETLSRNQLNEFRKKIADLKEPQCDRSGDQKCRVIFSIGAERKKIALDLLNRIWLQMSSDQSAIFYNPKDPYISNIILDNPEKDIVYISAGFHSFIPRLKEAIKNGDAPLWDLLVDVRLAR